jgi:putative Holliday junction resolvase
MGKALGIDFGLKRTGLAVTDDLRMIASGLQTVETKELMAFLQSFVPKENIDCFVIGQAIRMSGEMSAIEVNILELIKVLEKKFPLVQIIRQDERFTSKLALDAMIQGGVKKKDRRNKSKGLVDKVSATLILQAFLENQ